jgi:hypothetical protein
MGNERQSLGDRITELQRLLPIAREERRRRFLEACAYFSLAEKRHACEGFDLNLEANDIAALDNALDLFTEASAMVSNMSTEVRDKEAVRDLAAKRGLVL